MSDRKQMQMTALVFCMKCHGTGLRTVEVRVAQRQPGMPGYLRHEPGLCTCVRPMGHDHE